MCLGYDPTITNSVWLVKVAIRSRRQSIWVTYTSRRYTAFYTGFRCMLQLYIDLSSSRLACRDIQRIQRIQRIQLYSYTRYTAYSTIQRPSGQPSQPMRARRKPRTAAELRRAASSRPVHESAVLCLHGSQSHRWHVVRRTHHHPRHHQSTQGYRCGVDDRTHVHIRAPNKQEAPTQRRGGQGMTRQIASVAAPRHISLIYMHTLREYPAGQHPELDTSPTH